MSREEMNVVFTKLACLAGSRYASWAAIATCRRMYGRTPTLGEVVRYLTRGAP